MISRRAAARIGALGLIVGLSACGGGKDSNGGNEDKGKDFRVAGAAAKGPFAADAAISIASVDGSGAPKGKAATGKTTDALGQFDIKTSGGMVLAEANGRFFNELTGLVSDESVVLRAYANLKKSGDQQLFINTVSHLASERVKILLAAGTAGAEAIAQADGELDAALGIAVSTWTRTTPAAGLDLLAGDTEDSAYATAVGAVMLQVATHRAQAGASAASVQEVLDEVAADFADDGELEAALKAEIDSALAALPVDRIDSFLTAHFQAAGVETGVPNVDRILDTDGDGVANLVDNCPLIANPDQALVEGLCSARLSDYIVQAVTASALRIDDLNGDGLGDLMVASPGKLQSWIATQPMWFPTAPVEAAVQWQGGDLLLANFVKPVGDFEETGDYNLDLIGGSSDLSHSIMMGDGTGQFGAPAALLELADIGPVPFQGFEHLSVVDIDADGRLDLVGIFGGVHMTWSRGRPSGSFARPKPSVKPVANEHDHVLLATWPGIPDLEGEPDENGMLPMKVAPSLIALGKSAFTVSELNEDSAGPVPRGGHEALDQDPNYHSPVLGDFNGDGRVDTAFIATDDNLGAWVAVWLGDDSTRKFRFGPRIDLGEQPLPSVLHAADLNGDGKSELIISTVSAAGEGNVRILELAGERFSPIFNHTFPSRPSVIPLVTGDVDGDGILDLAWIVQSLDTNPSRAHVLRLGFDSVVIEEPVEEEPIEEEPIEEEEEA